MKKIDIYLEDIQGNLKDNYEIKDSDIHGKGVHSKEHFKPGDLINCCVSRMYDEPPNFDITHFGKYLNHSYEPSSEIRREHPVYNVYAIKIIKPGDEVTVDYTKTPEFKQPEDWWD
jgi:SET domain-containing protein